MLLNYKVLDTTSKIQSKIPEGVAMIGAPLEWSETQGKGIKVSVLDTRCPEHPDTKLNKGPLTWNDLKGVM